MENNSNVLLLDVMGTLVHEPFYRDYIEDDLAALIREAGFTIESVEPHFVSKVVVARKA